MACSLLNVGKDFFPPRFLQGFGGFGQAFDRNHIVGVTVNKHHRGARDDLFG